MGEEGGAAEEAEALTMAVATTKEVGLTTAAEDLNSNCHKNIDSVFHSECLLFPGGFGSYGYGNSANTGYSEYSFYYKLLISCLLAVSSPVFYTCTSFECDPSTSESDE